MLTTLLVAASAASQSVPSSCNLADIDSASPSTAKSTSISPNSYGLIAVEPLESFEREQLQEIAGRFPGDIKVENRARLFRIIYQTRLLGERVVASGLLALPSTDEPLKGTFVYLRGTNANRATAPSQHERVDGNEETAVFAGNGYAVVLPDYIGLGISKRPQAFLLSKPQVDASIDMLLASRSAMAEAGCEWQPSLYMMGFSQGGQVVAALHRELESNPVAGLDVVGSIGIAGPYDLRLASILKARETDCLLCVGYLAWAAVSYARYYGHDLAEAIRPEYVELLPKLFDGSIAEAEIAAQLPRDPAQLFNSAFLQEMRKNGDNWMLQSFDANETFRWVPKAPFRIHAGDADQDVDPQSALPLFAFAAAHRGRVHLHLMAGADHIESARRSYAIALKWYDELRAGK